MARSRPPYRLGERLPPDPARQRRRKRFIASIEDRDWYALRVRAQTERSVASRLRWQGACAVVPVHRSWRRQNRYTKSKARRERPIMPGYVWIALPDPANWHDVLCWDYVFSVVSFDGRPLPMNKKQVEKMLTDERNGLFADDDLWRNMKSYGEYTIGDEVEFDGSGFQGMRGKVVDITEAEAKVLIRFLGSERVVTAPVDACQKYA